MTSENVLIDDRSRQFWKRVPTRTVRRGHFYDAIVATATRRKRCVMGSPGVTPERQARPTREGQTRPLGATSTPTST